MKSEKTFTVYYVTTRGKLRKTIGQAGELLTRLKQIQGKRRHSGEAEGIRAALKRGGVNFARANA